MEQTPWTRDRLEATGHQWQERLGLMDWTVEYLLVRPEELDNRDMATCTRHTPNKRLATVRVADPALYGEGADGDVSVVHELLHLHLWELQDALDNIQEAGGQMVATLVEMARLVHTAAEERAVDRIAKALVALRRATVKEG